MYCSIEVLLVALPWVRRLVARPSPRGPVHVGFVVDKAALGQVVVLRFSPVYVIVPTLRTDKLAKSEFAELASAG